MVLITKHWPQTVNDPELCLPSREMGSERAWRGPELQTSAASAGRLSMTCSGGRKKEGFSRQE